jgi:hypothetical protein
MTAALAADALTSCGKPKTDLNLWSTPITRLRGLLAATIVLGMLLFAVTTTQATSAKQPSHPGSSAGQTAAHNLPSAPAGPQGPITLTCSPAGAGVVGAPAPAGPEGPVGVSCAASPNG